MVLMFFPSVTQGALQRGYHRHTGHTLLWIATVERTAPIFLPTHRWLFSRTDYYRMGRSRPGLTEPLVTERPVLRRYRYKLYVLHTDRRGSR
jgi:hypothetical protein